MMLINKNKKPQSSSTVESSNACPTRRSFGTISISLCLALRADELPVGVFIGLRVEEITV